MSFHRRGRPALSGIQSRGLRQGEPVHRSALGDVYLTQPRGVGAPRWYTAMQGTTLGDDAMPVSTDRLASIQEILAKAAHTAEVQKWFQIAATLSIPLAAAAWRWILKRRVPSGTGV